MSETAGIADRDPENLNYIERVKYWRRETPNGYDEEYDELLAEGAAPHIAAATIHYIAGLEGDRPRLSQQQISAEFDVSEVTLRRYHQTIRPELEPQQVLSTSRCARRVFKQLWEAEKPKLTTAEIDDRLQEFSRGHIHQSLRNLIEDKVVGSRYVTGVEKMYWAVDREDTPPYDDKSRPANDVKSKAQLIAEIGDVRGWERGADRFGSGPKEQYELPKRSGGNTVKHLGWVDLTGAESTELQLTELVDRYGLTVGEDITLSFSVNKSGYQKLHRQLVDGEDEGVEL